MILYFLLTVLTATGRGDPSLYIREVKARELVTSFAAGRFDAVTKDFNESLRSALQPDTLATLKQQIEAKAGAFRFVREVHSLRETNGFDSVELIAEHAKAAVAVRVVFDGTLHIGAVYMSPVVQEVDPKLEALARELHANFDARRFDLARSRFDGSMLAQLTPANFEQLRRQVEIEFGAFRSITDVRATTVGGFEAIDITAAYEKMPMLFRVVFDSQQKISGLRIEPSRDR